jgi:hypothetical protein
MSVTRVLSAAALIGLAVFASSFPACIIPEKLEHGAACLHDYDCESDYCVQLRCYVRNGQTCNTNEGCASGRCVDGLCAAATTVFDSGVIVVDSAPSDTPTDSPAETSADTTPEATPDTTPETSPDTTPADTADDG